MPSMPVLRRLAPPVLLASSLVLGACSDATEPEEEPAVQTVTLAVGSSSITIDKTTGSASGQLTVPAGTSTLSVVWKKADGANEALITSDVFAVKIVPTTAANLSFTANGAFGGTFVTTGLASGATTTAKVSLLHKAEGHEDFGPYNFTLRVQ